MDTLFSDIFIATHFPNSLMPGGVNPKLLDQMSSNHAARPRLKAPVANFDGINYSPVFRVKRYDVNRIHSCMTLLNKGLSKPHNWCFHK